VFVSLSLCVCVCVCVSVRQSISRTTSANFTKCFVHDAYRRDSVLLWRGDTIPREGAILGFSSPMTMHCKAEHLDPYKTAEPIEMPFGLMTRVGPRCYVLDGDPIFQGKGYFWGNVEAVVK